LIPGDGIGPEVSAAARRAVDATGVRIDWEIAELNAGVILKTGQSLPEHVVSQAQLNLTSAQIAAASARYDYQTQRTVVEYQIGTLR
jgi:isocitrate/isopropylmalate dehydrogenase